MWWAKNVMAFKFNAFQLLLVWKFKTFLWGQELIGFIYVVWCAEKVERHQLLLFKENVQCNLSRERRRLSNQIKCKSIRWGHCFRDDIRLSRDVVLLICRNRIIVFLHARPLIFPRLNQAEDDIASIWPHAAQHSLPSIKKSSSTHTPHSSTFILW